MWRDDTATSMRHCLCKLQTLRGSAFLNSPIHQAETNISVLGWGLTSHRTSSPISFGGWTLEGKVALLVTPQNAKAAIMQSWHMVLPWVLFLNYASSATGSTQSSFTGAEIRVQWEVSQIQKSFLYRNISNIITMIFVNTKSSRTVWLCYPKAWACGSQTFYSFLRYFTSKKNNNKKNIIFFKFSAMVVTVVVRKYAKMKREQDAM